MTEKSFNLYRNIKRCASSKGNSDIDLESLSRSALEIAGESHEIKKDNQRILSGLSRLISDESFSEYVPIHKIIQLAVNSNKKYATILNKEISFTSQLEGEHPSYHVYVILSIVNNLLANAVEAIQNEGNIHIQLYREEDQLIFIIQDNGPGIKNKIINIIFEPGFTTKYGEDGSASTGIGLSYVKSIVMKLHGKIMIKNNQNGHGATFTVQLPIESLALERMNEHELLSSR